MLNGINFATLYVADNPDSIDSTAHADEELLDLSDDQVQKILGKDLADLILDTASGSESCDGDEKSNDSRGFDKSIR